MSVLDNVIETSSFVIHSVGHTEIAKDYDWNGDIKRYPYCRIYYVKEAKNVFITVNGKEKELKTGYVYFIPSFSVSGARWEYLDHFWVHFKPSSAVNNVLDYYAPPFEVKAFGDEETWFYLLYDHYLNNKISSRTITSGAFKILFSRFLNGADEKAVKYARFEPVLEYIEKNLSGEIDLNVLSSLLYLDKVYFANAFKSVFGISPMQYVAQKRIDRARELLLITAKPVSEIAALCGFPDALYFSRIFKKKTLMTPTEYRKMIKSLSSPAPGDPL